ncbi:uncharacterized protein EI90DRAFT_3150283, partial [Cantharellus anzutake]|uniref:uncharacterized protein n=1 Tax=Cantharellus anzutake TaxID=1750568 RepID=UPI00190608D4
MFDMNALISAVGVLREELPKLHEVLGHVEQFGHFQQSQNETNEQLRQFTEIFQEFRTIQLNTNEQLLVQHQELSNRISNLEGTIMAGRAAYAFLPSVSGGSGNTATSDTQYPSPQSMILTLPRDDGEMSVDSVVAEDADEESLRKLREELMGGPEDIRTIIEMVSGSNGISHAPGRVPLNEPRSGSPSTSEGTLRTRTVSRSSDTQTERSPRKSSMNSAVPRRSRPPLRAESEATHATGTQKQLETSGHPPKSNKNPFRRQLGTSDMSESLQASTKPSSPSSSSAPATQVITGASHRAQAMLSPMPTRASTPIAEAPMTQVESGPPVIPQHSVASPVRLPQPPPLASTSGSPSLSRPQRRLFECIRELSDGHPEGVHINAVVTTLQKRDDSWTPEAILDAFDFLVDNGYIIPTEDDEVGSSFSSQLARCQIITFRASQSLDRLNRQSAACHTQALCGSIRILSTTFHTLYP